MSQTLKVKRVEIPSEIASYILFVSDRICCVCRNPGKKVIIHHIDDNPGNNNNSNLAVLCFDCHDLTQIKGGFGRRLDSDQVILYRDNWIKIIAHKRAFDEVSRSKNKRVIEGELEYALSLAEIYRENKEYELLAIHYDILGNHELRDKYIQLSIKQDPSDQNICFLRTLQNRPDLIPKNVIKREVDKLTSSKDYSERARLYYGLKNYREAVLDYLQTVRDDLKQGNIFSAAFYLKELCENKLSDELFKEAYKEFKEKDDLWWQSRCLEELGWKYEFKRLLISNSKKIEKSGDYFLELSLAYANGNKSKIIEIEKKIAKNTHKRWQKS